MRECVRVRERVRERVCERVCERERERERERPYSVLLFVCLGADGFASVSGHFGQSARGPWLTPMTR